jgi:hypothetical protein
MALESLVDRINVAEMRFILLCVVADELETAIILPKEW